MLTFRSAAGTAVTTTVTTVPASVRRTAEVASRTRTGRVVRRPMADDLASVERAARTGTVR